MSFVSGALSVEGQTIELEQIEQSSTVSQDLCVSVVICTYNRADRLVLALEALCQQTFSSEAFEVLVIDNRSSDHTVAVCDSFRDRLTNFRYVYEPVQGLSKARNTGWLLSQSPYIAYLDDDAIPCPAWVEEIYRVFETVQPQPISIGGPIYPLWEVPRPDWLSPTMEELFTILEGGDTSRWFKAHEYPWGANVIYRRDALEKFGGFCEQLGRKGQSLLSGEETLLNENLTAAGGQFYYSSQAAVHHWVPKERINPQWLIQRSYWQGYSVALVNTIIGKSLLYLRLSSTWNLLKRSPSLLPIALQLLTDTKARSQVGFFDRAKLLLSWQWGYFSKIWFG